MDNDILYLKIDMLLYFTLINLPKNLHETRITTYISSEALSNYKKGKWKMKVEKGRAKKTKNHETLKHTESFTFMSFVA